MGELGKNFAKHMASQMMNRHMTSCLIFITKNQTPAKDIDHHQPNKNNTSARLMKHRLGPK